MVHHRQRLAFGLKPRDDLPRVHSRLDDLQCDAASNRLVLLRHEHDAEAPLADPFEQLVAPDLSALVFETGRRPVQVLQANSRIMKKLARLRVRAPGRFDLTSKFGVVSAGRLCEGRPLGLGLLDADLEDFLSSFPEIVAHASRVHNEAASRSGTPSPPYQAPSSPAAGQISLATADDRRS